MSLRNLDGEDAFGSRFVPDTKMLVVLFALWKARLGQPFSLDLAQAVGTWNILASGAFFLTAILTGLRTRELRAPNSLYVQVWPSIEVQRQKGRPVAAYYPQRLRAYLSLVLQRGMQLQELIRDNGAGITFGGLEVAAFFYVELTDSPLWATCLPTGPETASAAFDQDPEFRRFLDLGWKWPRHWTNTVLREAELGENLVQRFHTHSPESFHALRWDQGLAVDIELHEYISEYLSSLLGL
jgi:hypothetical protein